MSVMHVLFPTVLSVLNVDSNRNIDNNFDSVESEVLPLEKTTSVTPKNSELNQLLTLTEFDDIFQINRERLICCSIILNWLQELLLADLPHTGWVQIKWNLSNKKLPLWRSKELWRMLLLTADTTWPASHCSCQEGWWRLVPVYWFSQT